MKKLYFLIIQFTLGFFVYACATPDRSDVQCYKIAVLPPHHLDSKISSDIKSRWIKQIKPRLKKCDQLINSEKMEDTLSVLHISHAEKIKIEDLDQSRVNALVEETDASHLVLLDYKLNKNKLTIRSQAYLTQPFRRLTKNRLERGFKFQLKDTLAFDKSENNKYALHAIQLLPNAFSFGISERTVSNVYEDENFVRKIKSKSNSDIPSFFSSLSVRNIIHPFGYNWMDVDSYWSFSINFLGTDKTYWYAHANDQNSPSNEPKTNDYDYIYTLQIYGFGPVLGRDFFLISPFGTSYFSLGIGPFFYTYDDSLMDRGYGATITTQMGLGHRAFMSKRWFLEFNFVFNTFEKRLIDNKYFIADSDYYINFGVGYYYPETKKIVRRQFN